MNKHTAGPWIARRTSAGLSGTKGWAIDFNEDQEQVVDFVYEESDARLIAAAPDLLEVLESIEMRLDAFNEAQRDMPADSVWVCLEKARAAIAKARGEG